jgi:hypothetical protein
MAMSALPPKADMCGANRHVCFGPKADMDFRWKSSAIVNCQRLIEPAAEFASIHSNSRLAKQPI